MLVGDAYALAPNNQGEGREAAAAEARFVSELDGCLPFAPPRGVRLTWAPFRTAETTVRHPALALPLMGDGSVF